MANRLTYPLEGVGVPGIVLIPFRFFPNGTNTSALVISPGATSTSTANAFVASVIRTGTAGQFTITLQDNWQDLLYANAMCFFATPATDINFTFSSPSFASASGAASSVLINALAGATPTDIASNAANYICVLLAVRNSVLNA